MGDKSTSETSALAYINAKHQLEEALKVTGAGSVDIEKISLENINKIRKMLKVKRDNIVYKANANGVVLFPQKGSAGSRGKQLIVGNEVKPGEVLLTIGDLSGLKLHISVDEINISKVKPGEKVTVTGEAFPGVSLQGHVSRVGYEAVSQGGFGGGSATFPVTVLVPKLTKAQQKLIHVGMTAKVAIPIKDPRALVVPMSAVTNKGGQDFVELVAKPKNRKVPVTVGHTTPNGEVVIKQGLRPGDKVVVYD